eukprot:2358588-Rhodomonas_salina.1
MPSPRHLPAVHNPRLVIIPHSLARCEPARLALRRHEPDAQRTVERRPADLDLKVRLEPRAASDRIPDRAQLPETHRALLRVDRREER